MGLYVQKIVIGVVLIIGLFGALWAGISVSDANYTNIGFVFLGMFGVFYLSGGYRYTIHVLLFFLFLNGTFIPGFKIGAAEQTMLLASLPIMISWWARQEETTKPVALQTAWFGFVNITFLFWLVYVGSHALAHLMIFDSEGLKNIIKSYNATFSPYLFALYFLCRPKTLYLPRNSLQIMSIILLVAIVILVSMRGYQHFIAGMQVDDMYSDQIYSPGMRIPWLFFEENKYALRTLGPIAMLWGIVILTTGNASMQNGRWKLCALATMALGTAGAFMSGGRAVILIGAGMVFCALVLRKRVLSLWVATAGFLILFSIINLFYEQIKSKTPPVVPRTMQYVLLEKDIEVMAHIDNSSRWRRELFDKAIDVWSEDAKTITIGQGFRGIEEEDRVIYSVLGNSAMAMDDYMHDISIRRVATHSLVSDILVGYGLVGFVIYYGLLIAMVGLATSIYFALDKHSGAKDLAMLVCALIWLNATVGNLAGSFLPPTTMWLFVFLIVLLYQNGSQQDGSNNHSLPSG